MFADIVGFTAWSSTREPVQVFTLLETIYYEFDAIATKRRIFKVETVGDCYVAAVGLPEPRKDHAVAMARFARDCLLKMKHVTTQLEVTLGPDTDELGLRIGIHSGPVTAGVLRGERARFQLFGDTMNTTARIETTGAKNRIHLSEETAQLLKEAGKEHWIQPREDKVVAKGKGELTTYWLNKADGPGTSHSGSSVSDNKCSGANVEENTVEASGVPWQQTTWSLRVQFSASCPIHISGSSNGT
jgi:class 3 adenylate cyclase